jgi:hypothetical protein
MTLELIGGQLLQPLDTAVAQVPVHLLGVPADGLGLRPRTGSSISHLRTSGSRRVPRGPCHASACSARTPSVSWTSTGVGVAPLASGRGWRPPGSSRSLRDPLIAAWAPQRFFDSFQHLGTS